MIDVRCDSVATPPVPDHPVDGLHGLRHGEIVDAHAGHLHPRARRESHGVVPADNRIVLPTPLSRAQDPLTRATATPGSPPRRFGPPALTLGGRASDMPGGITPGGGGRPPFPWRV